MCVPSVEVSSMITIIKNLKESPFLEALIFFANLLDKVKIIRYDIDNEGTKGGNKIWDTQS